MAALAFAAGCSHETHPTAASWHASSGSGSYPGITPSAGPSASSGRPVSRPVSSPPPSSPAPASPSASASSSSPAPAIIRSTGGATVALTFDDGPGPDTPTILKMLREQGVKATFCLIGVNVQEYPQYVQEIVKDGHTLCNHTWKHDEALGKKSADVIRADLQKTNDEIHKAVPDAQIKYFRHPGGNFTPAAVQIAADLGMKSLGWSVDPSDWNIKKWSGQQMTSHICSNVRNNTKPGSIVLSHDGGGDRSATVAAYKTLLPELANKFTLVAMPV
ncbi:polysaccharide deacetylase family protein [Dactylosporangium sp. CS-033363]|uniref:polysaccharide deacetylase family protein n=1 Tax=Dactylosporangium sp. CS-033363 TaxID=3239935 RepID=UPI003D8CA87C